ncbi:MAG: 16S rRNA (adenine(1518)-N(6)/adenine(1519)-N(6))-dimethyltransferase RsmA [Deltaproteobacteria bacterium]|nr:16S rRNA (adenine(1518)-N(6)/adenine(1519)-N(6))-dimethyltransferase RsmA [Deltaproteobacteria bacterium]
MKPKKSLGQHFLARGAVINRILRALDCQPEDKVLEIGPGRGALTLPLLDQVGTVLLVEKDGELAERLREKLGEKPVEILEGDFLELDWAELESRLGRRFKILSNLPYNVGTAIFTKLLRRAAPGTEMVLMFQREVGERLLAKPRGKEYGSLSVFAQLAAEGRLVTVVSPAAFQPPPKVESIVLRFRKREDPALPPEEWESFEAFVQAGFAQRRKMLRQNLRAVIPGALAEEVEARLSAVGANAQARAEELSVEQWIRLFKARLETLGR